MRFSIKPGDQIVENKCPNLVNKTGLANISVPNLFFISIKLFLDYLKVSLEERGNFFLAFFSFFFFVFLFAFFVQDFSLGLLCVTVDDKESSGLWFLA